MYLRQGISAKSLFWDSWRVVVIAAVWSAAVVYFHYVAKWQALALPPLTVTTIGVAVSLYLGFKTTQAYSRWWEARQIWGSIVNDSRTWANHALTLIDPAEPPAGDRARLIRRHLAWVNALAYQLRARSKLTVSDRHHIFDYRYGDGTDLSTGTPECYRRHLTKAEYDRVEPKANTATQIALLQGEALQGLRRAERLDDNRMVEMSQVLARFYDSQGKCERIKNTQFPWAITLFGRIFTWIYIVLLPVAFVDSFEQEMLAHDLDGVIQVEYMFAMVPFTTLISWFFYMWEKISESCEDPFEGGTSDIPISALTRTIEIDLLQMIDADDVPEPAKPVAGVLY